MMKVWFVMLALVGMGSKSVPQPERNGGNWAHFEDFIPSADVVLNLKSTLVSGNTVKIGFEIPYPGYIEFFLFDNTGKRLWYNAYVKDKGEQYLAFKREKLQSGAAYQFTLRYKGKDYPGTFVNN